MKKISDIRLYRSLDKDKKWPAEFASKSLNLAVYRVAMKLREQNFSLGDFDHLYLNFTTCRPVGTIELIEKVDQYHPWYRYCDIGVSQSEYESLDNCDCADYIFESVKTVLLNKFCTDRFSEEIVNKSIVEAQKGASMLIHFKEKKSAKRTAVIYLRLLDNGQYLPQLRVTDYGGNEILSADLPEILDLNPLGEILLSSKKVIIKPRKNALTNGLEPVSFELR